MAAIRHTTTTLRDGQQRRFHQAERDLQTHQRRKDFEIVLLLFLAFAASGAGIYVFHLLR